MREKERNRGRCGTGPIADPIQRFQQYHFASTPRNPQQLTWHIKRLVSSIEAARARRIEIEQ